MADDPVAIAFALVWGESGVGDDVMDEDLSSGTLRCGVVVECGCGRGQCGDYDGVMFRAHRRLPLLFRCPCPCALRYLCLINVERRGQWRTFVVSMDYCIGGVEIFGGKPRRDFGPRWQNNIQSGAPHASPPPYLTSPSTLKLDCRSEGNMRASLKRWKSMTTW